MNAFDTGGYIGFKKAYPTTDPIITDGLTLHLDAANFNSYPRSGSMWYDISGQENHIRLAYFPTFSTSNGGVLQFNGTTQYGVNSMNYSNASFTIMAGSRYSGATRGRVRTEPTPDEGSYQQVSAKAALLKAP